MRRHARSSGRTLRASILLAFLLASLAVVDAHAAAPPVGFKPPASMTVGSSPVSPVADDLNGDGIPDLAVANAGSSSGSVALGNGGGQFATPSPYVISGSPAVPHDLSTVDYNNDGKPDLLTAIEYFPPFAVLRGAGDGTFSTAGSLQQTEGSVMGIAGADFDGDGRMDVGEITSRACVRVWRGNGAGSWSGSFVIGSPWMEVCSGFSWGASVIAADFNGDHLKDLAFADSAGVHVALGRGSAGFSAPAHYFMTTGYVRAADLNGDGNLDLVTSGGNTFGSGNSVRVLLGRGDGSFGPGISTNVGFDDRQAAVGDFNGDGTPDIAAAVHASGTVVVLAGLGDGTFGAPITVATIPGASGLTARDLNGDGRADLAVTSDTANTVSVLVAKTDLTPPATTA